METDERELELESELEPAAASTTADDADWELLTELGY